MQERTERDEEIFERLADQARAIRQMEGTIRRLQRQVDLFERAGGGSQALVKAKLSSLHVTQRMRLPVGENKFG